jgi:uncharacterized membrane-anchored protein YhcB (DUF1043 family)
MKRSTLWIVLPILFLSGIIIGTYGGMKFTKRQVRGYAGRGPQRYLYRLIHDLELTEEQKQMVETSMNQAREESEKLNAEYQPKMQLIISNSYSEIFGQLTPEQKETLEAKKAEMQKRWAERRRRPRRRRDGTNTQHRSGRHEGWERKEREAETGRTGTQQRVIEQ